MKQIQLKNNVFKPNYYDMGNFFNIYPDENGNYYFNINRTLVIKGIEDGQINPSYYKLYQVKYGDSWTLISYNEYGTIELWWILCKFNNIMDPTSLPVEGTKIIIPTKKIADDLSKLMTNTV